MSRFVLPPIICFSLRPPIRSPPSRSPPLRRFSSFFSVFPSLIVTNPLLFPLSLFILHVIMFSSFTPPPRSPCCTSWRLDRKQIPPHVYSHPLAAAAFPPVVYMFPGLKGSFFFLFFTVCPQRLKQNSRKFQGGLPQEGSVVWLPAASCGLIGFVQTLSGLMSGCGGGVSLIGIWAGKQENLRIKNQRWVRASRRSTSRCFLGNVFTDLHQDAAWCCHHCALNNPFILNRWPFILFTLKFLIMINIYHWIL